MKIATLFRLRILLQAGACLLPLSLTTIVAVLCRPPCFLLVSGSGRSYVLSGQTVGIIFVTVGAVVSLLLLAVIGE